ncbi:hypothetical protein K378_01438 [Streptomyces sp. Amel2xB2]|uniref:hypothetical protein n=1 Tax=Streptomyces sp. Amel2xB2 TaxID=1305829 RepID=UPI000DB99FAC|nr:hypothetical protein [Streptomyces sp. Amel2xB2]RAJ70273.1 hypothetical protein K378_01438 [Streptomyces sp. Amel2xB2]
MPDPQQLAELAQGEHVDAVAALEQATTEAAVGQTDGQFVALIEKTLAAWAALTAGAGAATVSAEALRRLLSAVRAAVRRILTPLGPRAQRALNGALVDAVRLGGDQQAEFYREAAGRRAAAPTPSVTRALRQLADGIEQTVTDRRDRALALLHVRQARTWGDILTGIGAARSAVSAVRAHVSWVIGQAVNDGIAAGIAAVGARRLWVAERDACTGCLAYAGTVVDVGEPFPGGLNFDPRQRDTDTPGIDSPPLHPHCRCRLVAWHDRWDRQADPLPEVLREQALVAVAEGVGRPTESRAARVRAAAALLASGVHLPPAARRAAQQAARTGRFPQTA